MRGKPGLNPLNVDMLLQLNEEKFTRMKKLFEDIIKDLGLPLPKEEEGKEQTKLKLVQDIYVKGINTIYYSLRIKKTWSASRNPSKSPNEIPGW